jgi:hypothetical protein
VIGEGDDGLELPVDGRGEREGIEAVAEGHEGGDLRVIDVGAREHALERGARGGVATAEAGPDPFFAEELDGGQEEVLEQAELEPVEGVDRPEGGGRVGAEVAEQLAHRGPVLRLAVGVVVLLTGPAAGEVDGRGPAVVVPLIGVDARRRNGEARWSSTSACGIPC